MSSKFCKFHRLYSAAVQVRNPKTHLQQLQRSLHSQKLNEVLIVSGARTPFGTFGGQLSSLSVGQLGATVLRSTVEKAGIPVDAVDHVYMGSCNTSNEGQNPPRQAAIFAGLPDSVDATGVEKACATGMKSIMNGAESLMVGNESVILAGGMESMSRIPYFIKRETTPYGGVRVYDQLSDLLYDFFETDKHMAHYAEANAKEHNISREEQDNYAIESYKRALAAWHDGVFDNEVIPVTIKTKKGEKVLTKDEEPWKLDLNKVTSLKPVFSKDGTVTAANASPITDGACAVLLMTADAATKHNVQPLARVIAFADYQLASCMFPETPTYAVKKLLAQTGKKKEDISLWECNEAFSEVALVHMKQLGIDHSILNVNGGAVSLGHPVGASGARLVLHLALNLKPGELGVASICNGGGGASAFMLQKL